MTKTYDPPLTPVLLMMCPKSAYYRLVVIGKDVIYQMLLGMFHLLSPVGLANAAASSANMAELLKQDELRSDRY